MMHKKIWLIIGAILALLSIISGALATHWISHKVNTNTFEIAVRFQMFCSLSLLIMAVLIPHTKYNSLIIKLTLYIFGLGTLFFCGSLYILSFYKLESIGIITPIGGVLLILGWIMFIYWIVKNPINH
jgi:uncharacterized membrane protein YgdD (TMEM256/DUF423 family)